MIYHFQGHGRIFKDAFIKWLKEQSLSLPDNLTVITCESRPGKGLLIKQLEENNIPYINKVPANIEWDNRLKIRYILEALQEVTTEYVLILDNADVLLDSNNMDIVDKFLSTGKQLIFNASVNNHPECSVGLVEDIDERGCFKYLNAGCCIGTAEFAKQFYSKAQEYLVIENPQNSEQLIVRHTYENFREEVDIDSSCNIFQTMGGTVVYKDLENNWVIACRKF